MIATQNDAIPAAIVEVWCIEDLMDPGGHHSNTQAKDRALKDIVGYGKSPDGVIAFGTAAYPDEESKNRCVTIGSTIFLHQATGNDKNPDSNWSWEGHMERLVPSTVSTAFYSELVNDHDFLDSVSKKMLVARVLPGAPPQIIAATDAVGISSVNIASSANFANVDREAMALARAAGANNICSVETTHGVIRAQCDAPLIFVSGIPNRLGHFGDEANRNYPQNFATAHNAGVAVASLMPSIVTEFSRVASESQAPTQQ